MPLALSNISAPLEAQVAELRIEIERSARGTTVSEAGGDLDPKLVDALAVTQEIFGRVPTIELMRDPEDPDHLFLVITVKASGNAQDLLHRQLAWHDRVSRLLPSNSDTIRLSIIPE